MLGSVDHGKATLSAAIGKTMAKHATSKLKPYIVHRRDRSWGVYAENGAKAIELVEERWGKETVISVRRSEGDDFPRG